MAYSSKDEQAIQDLVCKIRQAFMRIAETVDDETLPVEALRRFAESECGTAVPEPEEAEVEIVPTEDPRGCA